MPQEEDFTDVRTRFEKFSSINEEFNTFCKKFDFTKLTLEDVSKLYECLGRIVLEPEYTCSIVQIFKEDLLNILYSLIPFEDHNEITKDHIVICKTLARVIDLHPDVKCFVLRYFEKYPAPFDKLCSKYPRRKRAKLDKEIKVTDLDVVSSCYIFLKHLSDFFRSKWNWADFIEEYSNSENYEVRWYCCRCIQIITAMNESQFHSLVNKNLNEENIRKCLIGAEKNSVLPVGDSNVSENVTSDNNECSLVQVYSNLVCVCGIYLPIYEHSTVTKKSQNRLVEVESTKANLRKIALGIAANKAICLQGPVGSGKSCYIEYLAEKTGRILGESFIKIQLGDQTDGKMLLGSYCCTDVPGEFVWQPGILTQAVAEGSWLLLEDVDLANMDIASILNALLENGCLTVPGYRDSLPITPGFQLFLTQRLVSTVTGYHRRQTNSTLLLEKNVLQINIDPSTPKELEEIIQTLYPSLKTISNRIVDAFLFFSEEKTFKNERLISTRDLFKWCSRAAIDFDVTSKNSALNVLQDGIDVLTCSISNLERRINFARKISTLLGIINENADYYCDKYKPSLCLTTDSLKSSRVSLQKQRSYANSTSSTLNFCFTRPAACLLERIMCCIKLKEPVLLVGETGTGKTSAVQYLANLLGHKLIVINMNQQSDSADLLGGYKPVDLKFVIAPIRQEFERIFRSYFNVIENKKFLENIDYCFNEQKWELLIKLMKKSYESALTRLKNSSSSESVKTGVKRVLQSESENLTFMDKQERNKYFLEAWTGFGVKLEKLEVQLKHKNILAFSFIKGSLIKAVENGHWVLLDEINLANAETLECLSGLLEGTEGSLSLMERGDKKPIKRHPEFILFACMNPSTDVGKRDLPAGLRNRFTEFFVEELVNKNDLMLLVESYLTSMSLPKQNIESITKFYLNIRKEAENKLCDGLGHKPHFSLRTLCRALMIAAKNPCGTFNRSLHEAFCLSFLTQLDPDSYKAVEKLIIMFILGSFKDAKGVLKQPIPKPKPNKFTADYVQFEGYWVPVGHLEPGTPSNYILTQSVRRNLKDLVRVVAVGNSPVLLQGDTSVGKTSLIMFLAKSSGNKCVRINNHEHTDLQEYIGSYVADISGKLVFREGLLVEAMREGHWIILDELNLAPTDVLEALNRVLDDNRELLIAETQQTVKAHPNFKLFATQNPPGAYGGRKMLSRAFRNRFVELHFNEIPPAELEFILHKRCEMPASYAKKMVAVMTELQMRRRGSAAFAGKHGFMTLRDLFRWGERYRLAQDKKSLYDWDQHLVDEGYLLLAGKVRKSQEKQEIADALHKNMKREVVPQNLFTLSDSTSTVTKHILESLNKTKQKNIVWTFNMRQLAVLVTKALEFHEPVLLVGETGGGKTTVCKIFAENNSQELFTVNCHMHTESSDFIGGLRPVRDHSNDDPNRLFEWVDGPLIKAMQTGSVFLADEISLADDSVLERLNSLLEPERSLLLAEKGSDLNNRNNSELIIANKNFHFIGTMNPGGDFGKKELSPALRNRFTEIWCESCTDKNDLIAIIEQNLESGISLGNQEDCLSGIGKCIMDFIDWFKSTDIGKRFTMSIRDVLTWVNFINSCSDKIDIVDTYLHGAFLTFLDSFGSGITGSESIQVLRDFQKQCLTFLKNQLAALRLELPTISTDNLQVEIDERKFGIKPFYIPLGSEPLKKDLYFTFDTPTCAQNALRVLRGLQLNKAILLEGSPGVGKTSLVTALAKATRNRVLRINLSDQTDISDLFGADLPVEGGTGGQFAWKDGPFLRALKQGHWILLDELNLASQSVLEGLNACLDHRGEIFIPELGKTFYVKPGTRLFACQNPLREGGSRRGLPQSFLNRFTQVYVHSLQKEDLIQILNNQFSQLTEDVIKKMVDFNDEVIKELNQRTFGLKGAPWEFNLRDLTRWCEAVVKNQNEFYEPERFIQLIYGDRMRSLEDKEKMKNIFESVFKCKMVGIAPTVYVTKTDAYFGDVRLSRQVRGVNLSVLKQEQSSLVLRTQVPVLRSLAYCVKLNWMAIVIGSSGVGKSSIVRTLANLLGKTLHTLPVTSAMDTTDILGGFEQVDYTRHLEELIKKTEVILLEKVQDSAINRGCREAALTLRMWENFSKLHSDAGTRTMADETRFFIKKLQALKEIWKHLLNSTIENVEHLHGLQEKGEVLYRNIIKEGNLNAGGKFEWVDSILIKCLQEGSWLLIDNVNLCSPAVLDRLNAVLEPNGVLSIGERGVKDNGELVEIKPHKDFRLFLTMDPKNGEISRAMRNRGVEIYMLNSTENETCTNLLDVKALINQVGLTDNVCVEILLKMHEFMANLILGEKFNLNSCLQVSFLISLQLLRGKKLFPTFYNSIVDVYYKNRSENEFKPNALDEIKIKLEELFLEAHGRKSESNLKLEIDSRHATLNVKTLNGSSEIEQIKQQTVLLRTSTESSLLWQHLLINSYSVTSLNDLEKRFSYLKEILEPNLQNLQNKLTLENLHQTVLKNIRKDFPDIPQDCNWIPDSSIFVEAETRVNFANKLYLMMYFNSTVISQNIQVETKNKVVTLEGFLRAIQVKKAQGKLDDILEKELLNLLTAFDTFFLEALQLDSLKLNSQQTVAVVLLLQMRFVLSRLMKVSLEHVSLTQYQNIFKNLQLHYKWFLKHSIKFVNEIFNIKIDRSLEGITKKINNFYFRDFSVMKKIGKTYQKCILKPLPLSNEVQINCYQEFNTIYQKLDLCDRRNDMNKILKCFFKYDNLRQLLIDTKSQLDYKFTEELPVLLELKQLYTNDLDIEGFNIHPAVVSLLPIFDYFGRISLLKMKTHLGNNFLLDEQNILKELLTIPANLLGTMELYQRSKQNFLQHELKSDLFYYLLNAASLKPVKYLTYGTDQEENKEISANSSVLCYLLLSLLVSDKNEKDTLKVTKLGNYREIENLHRSLNLVLWKNLQQISSYVNNYISNEVAYLEENYKVFLEDLLTSLSIPNPSENCSMKFCLEKIKTLCATNDFKDLNDDQNNFIILLQQCEIEITKLKANPNSLEILNTISNGYCLLNYIKALLCSKLPIVDSLMKIQLKKQYCMENTEILQSIKQSYELQNEVYSCTSNTLHSHVAVINSELGNLTHKRSEFEKYVAIRPTDITYDYVFKEVSHYFSTILAPQQVLKLYNNSNELFTAIQSAINNKTAVETRNYEKSNKEMLHSINNYLNLIDAFKRYRYGYPDFVEPLLSSITEFLYGLKMKLDLNCKVLSEYETLNPGFDLNKDLLNVIKFPVLHKDQKNYREVVRNFTNDGLRNFLTTLLRSEEHEFVHKQEHFRLLKCGIHELYNACILDTKYCNDLEKGLFNQFDSLLKVFISAWKQQEEDLELKRKEEESLYKIKANKTEEEELEEQFKQLFPSFHDQDFSDLQPDVLGDDKTEEFNKNSSSRYVGIITTDDVRFVYEIHAQILQLCTKAEWLNPSVKKNIECDFITPLLQKFKLLKLLLEKYNSNFDFSMDSEILASLNVLIAVTQRFGDVKISDEHNDSPTRTKKRFDFYKDPKIDQVKGAYHILEELHIKISEFLTEWPEHPGLLSIKTVIDRIYGFDISSPLSRFLTGFEILLTKCHEWEENAHAGVSLTEHIQNLVQQIIAWRKIEMNAWKDSLNSTFDRMNEPVSKWWFYLYSIMLEFIQETTINPEQLVATLQKFITQSNLAEFENRLNLLLTFHYHAVHLEYTKKTEMFVNILWNLHQYFQQFVPNVQNKIKELRAPIEKKLKEYVKIVKWKDISYWAIKETCEKTHKTLHKHIREFENVLKETVTSCLVSTTNNLVENIGIWDRPQRHTLKTYHYTMEPATYMAKRSLSKNLQINPQEHQGILAKSEKYFYKSRKICKDTIITTNYPALIQSLDGFVTDVIETSTRLQNTEVDTTLPKNKQKSQAKGILQQKRKALSDLFKALTELGLSYRAGITQSKMNQDVDQFLIKPIDLNAAFQHISYTRTNEKLLTIWDGCEMYYTKSLARLDTLETSLKNPSKELGVQNLERLKGFSINLMNYIKSQKTELITASRHLYYLRHYSHILNSIREENYFLEIEKFEGAKQLLKNICTVMEQYTIILHTCPEQVSLGNQLQAIPVLKPEQPDFVCYKREDSWKKAMNHINNVNATSRRLLTYLEKFNFSLPSTTSEFVHPNYVQIAEIDNVTTELNLILAALNEFYSDFGTIPLMESTEWLILEIKQLVSNLNRVEMESALLDTVRLQKYIVRLMHKLLMVAQNIHNKYKQSDTITATSTDETKEEIELKENHLKNCIVNNLSDDINILEMGNVLKLVQKLASELFSKHLIRHSESRNMLVPVLPLLEQITLLYQYFVTQQISAYRTTSKMSSILSNIFIDLATKGFCIPPEFSEELSNDEGQAQGSGLGLGEGEGERDVSDKIESEDQLEDAQPAGQEKKKEEDKDCKEEEKGIEMSEDFEGKLQDVDKGEENEEDNDESDGDEQMGETEKGADQLDQQLWGSDNEEEEDEEESPEKEEQGSRGETEGESELGAKKDNKTNNEEEEEDNDSGKDNKKEKKNKEINEMDEPEIDDEQVDPYHGNQPQYPEPEAMELPDDLQLDEEGDDKEEKDENETNPFDIDTMKEQMPPPDKDADKEEDKSKENTDDKHSDGEDSDEDETQLNENKEDSQMETEETEQVSDKEEKEEDIKKPKDKTEEDAEQNIEDNDDQSALDATQAAEETQAMDIDDVEAADNVQTNPVQNQKASQTSDDVFQEDNPDKDGVGQSQMEESTTGHKAQANAQDNMSSNFDKEEEKQKKRKPGESDSQRSLGNVNEPVKKKLKTIEIQETDVEETTTQDEADKNNAEMYKHIKEAKDTDEQMLDTATKEQVQQQKDVPIPEEEEKLKESSENLPDDEEEQQEELVNEKQKPEKMESKDKKQLDKGQHPEGDFIEETKDVEIEGEIVQTATVPRGNETTHHTQYFNINDMSVPQLSIEEINQLRTEVEQQLSHWNEPPTSSEAEQAWERISAVTSSLAQGLSEQLRLVLEPTQASRLKGDYRTGRRINMRKVIPYIASQFRKDKIWLRRTKPSKREYQIALAIDDSSSMCDNHSKELAFESVALISKALTLLESGQLSILSFGENTEVLHKLTDTFTEKSGSKLLQKFQFTQKKTCVGKLVDFATEMLNTARSNSTASIAKLLIVVSDGRGVFSEGETYIQQAVRRAKLSNIFMVFIVIDNSESKDSILDIRKPIFKDGKLLGIKSYMDSFPFPFYIILRDINSLPNVLSDALRQWFEIVSNADKQ